MRKKSYEFVFNTVVILSFLVAALSVPLTSSQSLEDESDVVTAAPGEIVKEYIILEKDKSGDNIPIKAPIDIQGWILHPMLNPSIQQGALKVNSKGNWKVSVLADMPTSGYMAEYDAKAKRYISNGKKLRTALKVYSQGGNAVSLSEGGVLIEGSGKTTIPITFEQGITWFDVPLPEGRIYHIEIIFTVSVS